MKNPKTTICGILMLVGALSTMAAHLLSGASLTADMPALLAALAGLGLIVAKDGSA